MCDSRFLLDFSYRSDTLPSILVFWSRKVHAFVVLYTLRSLLNLNLNPPQLTDELAYTNNMTSIRT